ncbi:hypothetical protein PRIPAC_92013 [Pristionchus pacificus]|uniref:Uncharacterized protein n=1 Tax=Pristionchus pacificus TaxID=54126 RepID=A0A2A6CIC5_PRIPA|nr:hypothetical protein PRIPAC_92013 [Pristionchus pacificus]|eukprot:PDM77856.1 hypothetical protein PRIPAC_34723 [Pristionchus pacificus]
MVKGDDLVAGLADEAKPNYQNDESFSELLRFLAQTITAPNVEEAGNENGKKGILCEKSLGQKPKKCQFFALF